MLPRPIDLIRFATDASPYRLFPKVIVIARNVDVGQTVAASMFRSPDGKIRQLRFDN